MFARTIIISLIIASSAVAFTPVTTSSIRSAVRVASEPPATPEVAPEPTPEPPAPVVVKINGWAPDASKPCYGLPGAIGPFGFFDPLGLCPKELLGCKRVREAEVMHGRVGMMAVIGFLVGENTPTISYGFDKPTVGINQLAEAPGTVLFTFFLVVNIAEAWRANRGWVEPGLGPVFTLRENYYPGDIGFDPLGLKPTDAKEFENMQAKELSNGRLAMLAAAGFVAQELVNGKPILENLGM
mmetsp:Transcript_25326/g.34789  ORF Transcript_25326/g.34789 Transcript_25326/m.34789 type:complete len:241 (-) Transcript_25326:133-855(-)|eukprot:CAMPEP_0185777750 /NCGR_PEP_ID=MMETSP1174-20130828/90582_1 /TAXON_ID=35687 /ORGANISM="Dictyocha speculum, Strain CCMP1381" /LENGTH=240 /DNA_ID=CAMNT_0028466241 /DNA_START=41 /DNA_END=763 /DNA_ORIENTATION=+